MTDTRAQGQVSYAFQYSAVNGSGIPHILKISGNLGTDETYSFALSNPLTLSDPFSAGATYPNVTELTDVTDQIGFQRQFGYDASGELTAFGLPNGGLLQWTYTSNTYSWSSPSNNTIALMAVQNRYLAPDATASTTYFPSNTVPSNRWQYTFGYNAPAAGQSVMTPTCVQDVTAQSLRCWSFSTGQYNWSPLFEIGLVIDLQRWSTNSAGAPQTLLRDDAIAYTADAVGNPYVSSDNTTDFTGTTTLYSGKTQQVDQWGNVTQSAISDWNTTQYAAWTRQYNSTYRTTCSSPFTSSSSGADCGYVNTFITNLLVSQTLTDSLSNFVTLATNTYDNYTAHAITPVSGLGEFDPNFTTAYQTRGNLTQSVVPGATTNTYYDQTGMATGADDNNGHAVSVTMASGTNNSAPGLIQPNTGSSNDSNLATSMTYSSFLGVASATAPNSSLTTIAYDTNARPSTAVAPTGASTTYAYAFGTTANGNIANGPYTTTATTNTHWSTTVTDGLGRALNSQAGYLTSGGSTQVSQVDTYYEPCGCSPAGKAWKISQPYGPGGTKVYTAYTYDALGRPLTVTLPDGVSLTSYAYQGNWTTVNDPAGKWKQYETDIFGNTIEVVEPDPNYSPLTTTAPSTPGTGNGILVTNYTYDFVSHLIKVTMTRAGVTQTRTSVYDPGTLRLTSATSPETGPYGSSSGTTSYTYNADGTLYQRTDPSSQVTTYTYDSYQRVTKVTHGTDATQTYSYTYDTGTNGYGHLTQVTWGGICSGSTLPMYAETYGYTGPGQVSGKSLTVTQTVSGGCRQATASGSFAYDNEGKPTGTTYPEFLTGVTAPSATFSYDHMSRLTGVTDTNELNVTACSGGGAGSETWASGGTYNAAGQLIGLQRLQSVSGCAPASPLYFNQAWQYNSLNQLTEIDTSAQTNGYPNGSPSPGLATYFFAKYAFSGTQNNGQITSMTDARTGNTVAYTYDLLKRLSTSSATGGNAWTQTFGYDGFGNLTSKSVPPGSSEFTFPAVNSQKNQLASTAATYDSNGNTTVFNGATLGYDLGYDMENRLTSYSSGTFVENYFYDEGNRRVEKRNTTGFDAVYFYGPDGKLLSVLQATVTTSYPWLTLSTVTNRVYFGGMLLGTSTGYASADSNLIKDRLGSKNPSYPYGTDIGTQAGEGDDFATYWKDNSSGFQYARSRYYSAGYARFLTMDPFSGSATAEVPGTWNRYTYASGDPVNKSDPSGLDDGGDPAAVIDGTPLYLLNFTEVNVTDLAGDGDGGDSDVGDSGDLASYCAQNHQVGNPYTEPLCGGLMPFSFFHSGSGGGAGGSRYSIQTVYALAKGYSNAVRNGIVTDCQALADFANDVASKAGSNAQFVGAFAVLTPSAASDLPTTGIGWSSDPVALNTSQISGYESQYQNTLPDNPSTGANGDQGHHFAAFFQFGFTHGSAAGSVLAYGLEYFQGLSSGILNAGDVALGKFAATLGAEVKAGTILPGQVGQQISSTLCNP